MLNWIIFLWFSFILVNFQQYYSETNPFHPTIMFYISCNVPFTPNFHFPNFELKNVLNFYLTLYQNDKYTHMYIWFTNYFLLSTNISTISTSYLVLRIFVMFHRNLTTRAGNWLRTITSDRPYTIIRHFPSELVGMTSLDRNCWKLVNLLFVSPVLYWNTLKTEKSIAILGRKNSRRAWHVIPAQEVKRLNLHEKKIEKKEKRRKETFPVVILRNNDSSRWSRKLIVAFDVSKRGRVGHILFERIMNKDFIRKKILKISEKIVT